MDNQKKDIYIILATKNPKLTPGAIGTFAYLLTLDHIQEKQVRSHFVNTSNYRIAKYFQNLQRHHYLKRTRYRNAKGQIANHWKITIPNRLKKAFNKINHDSDLKKKYLKTGKEVSTIVKHN